MTEENQIKERGPGPLMMSVYIILFLIIGAVLSITIYKKYFALPAAKVTATKVIHAQTVKHISGELNRCTQNETSIMNNSLMCSEINSTNVIQAALNLLRPVKYSIFLLLRFRKLLCNDQIVNIVD